MEQDINESKHTHNRVNQIHFHSNGNIQFEGEVDAVTGKKEGQAKIYYENGNKLYTGEFKNNKKEGAGKYYYDETGNLMYEGEFKIDFKNGKGVSYHPNGVKSYEGKFKNDTMNGFGLLYGPQGDLVYRGYLQLN